MLAEPESPEVYARRTITHALRRSPYEVWTREALASRFGISQALTARILTELVGAGVVERLEGPDEEYALAGSEL